MEHPLKNSKNNNKFNTLSRSEIPFEINKLKISAYDNIMRGVIQSGGIENPETIPSIANFFITKIFNELNSNVNG